jgi:hypothetical protein
VRTLVVEFQPMFHGADEGDIGDSFTTGPRGRVAYKRAGTPGKHYHYCYAGQKEVKRGDWAVVHNGNEFGIVQVKRCIPGVESKVTKHVLMVITQEEFERYLTMNKQIDEFRGLMDQLDYRLEQHKKLERYEDLASSDPTAKAMVDRLKSFFGLTEAPQLDVAATPTSAPAEEEFRHGSDHLSREDIDRARPPGDIGSGNA